MAQVPCIKVACSGIVIGAVSIPAFNLYKNEMLFIKWPLAVGIKEEKIFFKILLKERKNDCVQVFGNASRVGRLLSLNTSFFFTYRWCKKTVFEYLQFFTRLTSNRIEEILHNMDISLSETVGLLPGTQRLLVEIEIALINSDILIFSTDGLDPLGERRVVEYIREKLSKISAICICYPLIGHRLGEDTCSNIAHVDKTSIIRVERI